MTVPCLPAWALRPAGRKLPCSPLCPAWERGKHGPHFCSLPHKPRWACRLFCVALKLLLHICIWYTQAISPWFWNAGWQVQLHDPCYACPTWAQQRSRVNHLCITMFSCTWWPASVFPVPATYAIMHTELSSKPSSTDSAPC